MTNRQGGKSLIIDAPLKLNLFLHITGRREDGYHCLESLFAFTNSGDQITISTADTLSILMSGPFATSINGPIQDNLVYQAARAVEGHVGKTLNARIQLEKNIPVAAGVGGGSADAAATLIGLNRFFELAIPDQALQALALTLGADVPACLSKGPQFVTGIGEAISPATPDIPGFVVLVNPGVQVSTPTVFKAYKDQSLAFRPSLGTKPDRAWASIESLNAMTVNSLQAATIAIVPEVQDCIDVLARARGCEMARMSGSGPTCFGLFTSKAESEAAANLVLASCPDWWVYADQLAQG